MFWYQIFQDGPEYEVRRKRSTFTPPDLSLKTVQAAVPKYLFKRSTIRSLYFVIRHLAITYAFYVFATRIDLFVAILSRSYDLGSRVENLLRATLWIFYWGWQGIAFAGIWCLGHETGHDALSSYPIVNAAIGLVLHTFLLVPYFAWRITHRLHHQSTNNLERDQTYIPPTRKDFKLPDGKIAVKMDYEDILEETPAFSLFKLFMRQLLGYQLYLLHNRKGNPKYPPWSSHYKPSSLFFKPKDRQVIVLSNVSIGVMLSLLGAYVYKTSWSHAWKLYFVPWLLANNWIVTITYLQHSDPTIPYYRPDQWTFVRGALATVDRPILGWVGRFFFHNLAHDHVAHHFFSTIPFYNQPLVTEAIKPILGEYYNCDSTYTVYALWRSFRQCTFVEDDADVVFFKDQHGKAICEPRTAVSASRPDSA